MWKAISKDKDHVTKAVAENDKTVMNDDSSIILGSYRLCDYCS